MLYRELGTSCVGPAIYIYEKIKFESQRSLGFAGHPAIETRCITAVGSFKFEFFKILSAESICLKLSFRLHVVAWQPDNGKYVRLKSRVRLNIRVQGVFGALAKAHLGHYWPCTLVLFMAYAALLYCYEHIIVLLHELNAPSLALISATCCRNIEMVLSALSCNDPAAHCHTFRFSPVGSCWSSCG